MKTAIAEVSERPPELVAPMSPANSSSSGSGSDSESDSETSSEDSGDENNAARSSLIPPKAATPQEPPPASPKHEEEAKPPLEAKRWNLGSYLDQDGSKTSQTSPLQNITSNNLPLSPKKAVADTRKKVTEESDCSDSTKELDSVVAEALAKPDPLLSSLSDSDVSVSAEIGNKRTKRFSQVDNSSDDSDVELRTKKKGPMNRVSPRKKSLSSMSEDEDSDIEMIRKKEEKVKRKPGRPRKVKVGQSGSETEVKVKKRGRPPTKRTSLSGSENDVKVKKRGRPSLKNKVASPSSSEDEIKPSFHQRLSKRDVSVSDDESPVRNYSSHSADAFKQTTPKRPPKHSKSVTPRSEDDRKKSVGRPRKHHHSDDDEWGKQNIKKKQKVKERSSDTSTNREPKESPVKKKETHRRKGKNNLNIKSAAQVPTTTDSESDQDAPASFPAKPLARVPPNPRREKIRRSSSSCSEKSIRMKSSDSDRSSVSRPQIPIKPDSPVKVEAETKPVQDKKKNDTLRKLFTPKRDSEGGKGGGKGGAKGGKGGKGKGGVIIVDGDYERSSSSVEDETMPSIVNPTLLSPLPSQEVVEKCAPTRLDFQAVDQAEQFKLMVRIDLSRLSFIPTKRRSEEMRSRTELSDTRQRKDSETFKIKSEPEEVSDSVRTNDESDRVTASEKKQLKWDVSKKEDSVKEKHKMKGHKRKRHHSSSSVSSLSSALTHESRRSRKEHHKSKDSHKSKRRKAESENQMLPVKSEVSDAPPTNHERETKVVKAENEVQSDVVEGTRTYYSYFEKVDEDRSDEEGRSVFFYILVRQI